jgi:hypothetical protein
MSPYELVEQLARLSTDMYDTLHVGSVDLEDGGTAHVVTSGLFADSPLRTQIAVEGEELVRRQTLSSPVRVVADIVKLQPPNNNHDGDAQLHHIEQIIEPRLAEVRRPFRAAAVEAATVPGPSRSRPAVRFDGIHNMFYRPVVMPESPDETYLSDTDNLTILGGEQTNIHLTEIGKDELDHEIGVLASFSGLVRVVLQKCQFVRVTENGILYGPSEEKEVELHMPPDTPQLHESKFHRIPDDGNVGFDEKGNLIPQGTRGANEKYAYTNLNPSIAAAKALKLMRPSDIDWTNGTDAFLTSLTHRLTTRMPLNHQASYEYERMRHLAQKMIRNEALVSRKPLVDNVGCLAVTDRLIELSTMTPGARRVDVNFFSQAA